MHKCLWSPYSDMDSPLYCKKTSVDVKKESSIIRWIPVITLTVLLSRVAFGSDGLWFQTCLLKCQGTSHFRPASFSRPPPHLADRTVVFTFPPLACPALLCCNGLCPLLLNLLDGWGLTYSRRQQMRDWSSMHKTKIAYLKLIEIIFPFHILRQMKRKAVFRCAHLQMKVIIEP